MDDQHLKMTIQSLANNKYAMNLIFHLIEKSNCFHKGIAKDERTQCYNKGYADFGLYLTGILIDYAPNVYCDYLKNKGEKNER